MSRAPGFTAERSLGRTAGYVSRDRPGAGDAQVVPQSLLGRTTRRSRPDGCIPNCICVTLEGCPCCDVLWPMKPIPTTPRRLGF